MHSALAMMIGAVIALAWAAADLYLGRKVRRDAVLEDGDRVPLGGVPDD